MNPPPTPPPTAPPGVGYYVHHHGAGHVTRAALLAAAVPGPVTGLSSLPRPATWAGHWLDLPRDDTRDDTRDGPGAAAGLAGDPTAGGALHWAPLGHAGYRDRMAVLAGWVTRARPRLFVVDVSVEVTLLVRLLGVPVAVVAMRGRRDDPAHVAAYDAATLLIAPWPGGYPEPWWPQRWRVKTVHAGALSRLDALAPPDAPGSSGPSTTPAPGPSTGPVPTPSPRHRPVEGDRRVAVLWGHGGGAWTSAQWAAAQAATPGWRWSRAGAERPLAQDLADADVVVCHGGQNAVAEVAALRRPAVVVALPRPYAEQEATAAALEAAALSATTVGLPEPSAWPDLLARALARGGHRWRHWNDGHGAARAGAAIAAAAAGRPIAAGTAVITIVHGRHRHLRQLIAGLSRGTHLPDRLVVVAVGDPAVQQVVTTEVSRCAATKDRQVALTVEVVELAHPAGAPLPLARARNLGARTAAAAGCPWLIFLDVDCIPAAALVGGYHDALTGAPAGPSPARATGPSSDLATNACPAAATGPSPAAATGPSPAAATGPTIWAGPVTYLPPLPAGHTEYDAQLLPSLRAPHPARPDPPAGQASPASDPLLFWSLSFAMSAADYAGLGGFCEDYSGYGGEDTDFAMLLQQAHGTLWWLGGADAYHQHHPSADPPVQHLDDIIRNANLFTRRWGWHPMQGWLSAFAAQGLARYDATSGAWAVGAAPAPPPAGPAAASR